VSVFDSISSLKKTRECLISSTKHCPMTLARLLTDEESISSFSSKYNTSKIIFYYYN
jgi:hypothetical protein